MDYSAILKKYNYSPTQLNVPGQVNAVQSTPQDRIKEIDAILSGQDLTTNTENKRNVADKIAGFTGGEQIGKGLATGIRQLTGSADQTGNEEGQMFRSQQEIIDKLQTMRDVPNTDPNKARLLDMLKRGVTDAAVTQAEIDPGSTITNKQLAGDALQLATTIASAGAYGKAVEGAKTFQRLSNATKVPTAVSTLANTTGFLKGAGVGVLKGAAEGAVFGASTGASQGLKNNETAGEITGDAIYGGVGGGITGGVLGGIIGGISGVVNKSRLRESVLQAQEQSGLRPALQETITLKAKTDPKFNFLVNEAKKQGFNESEINFLASVSPKDKPVMKKMYDLTVKAQSDPRQITRAGDILGENVTQQVKQVIDLNKKAGKAVDLAAKSLKGQSVNVAPLAEKIVNKLEDAGISIQPNGALDFSQSVFKNTPQIQKELQKVILSVPDGSDAYQLHIFKKSLDEIVDFGTAGEGLKGGSANIIKALRSATDEVLDSAFEAYNTANTDFKVTKEYIDMAKGMVGKKVDLASKEGSQAFGQALRSAFSNNKSRPNTLKFIEDTHLLSKQLGLSGSEKNLLDQAIYVNMLEETFGSEAATGLAGEVSKAINKSMSVIQGIKSPLKGAGQVAGYLAEKAANISPEAKKQVLRAFLK